MKITDVEKAIGKRLVSIGATGALDHGFILRFEGGVQIEFAYNNDEGFSEIIRKGKG